MSFFICVFSLKFSSMEITPYTDGDMDRLLGNRIPKTTKNNNTWTSTTYEKWAAAHARVDPEDNVL